MRKYRKKPVVIEAEQYLGEQGSLNACIDFTEGNAGLGESGLEIDTLEGVMQVKTGDYIIKGIHGEFYPCKPDIFEKTYELVE